MKYDPEKHEYTLNDKRLFSVTEVLPKMDFHCSPERLEETHIYGVENHGMIKLFLDTGDTFDDPYIMAFSEWLDENYPVLGKLLYHEQPMLSIKHAFAGTPDIIFEKAIVDNKRSFGDKKIHALQLAGYYLLAREKGIKKTKTWLIISFTNGKFKARNVYDDRAENIFLACLNRYKNDQLIDSYLKST